MKSNVRFSKLLTAFVAVAIAAHGSTASADLGPGVISDFEDGTVQGWGGGTVVNIPDGGPLGAGDNYLQLSNGGGGNFAMHNIGVNGNIDPTVSAITVDLMRPIGEGALELRLVLQGPGGGPFSPPPDQWTSTNFISVPDDGMWHSFEFSILESDLTHVGTGTGTYQQLTSTLNRIMFRYDPGPPTAGGLPAIGTLGFDNITAITAPLNVVPESFAIITGSLVSGGLPELIDSDDQYLVMDPTFTMFRYELVYTVDATSSTDTPSELEFNYESKAFNIIGTVEQKIELFNYVTGQYETVDTRNTTPADSLVSVTPTGDPARFVEAGTGAMRARISNQNSFAFWIFVFSAFFLPYETSVDHILWTVTP